MGRVSTPIFVGAAAACIAGCSLLVDTRGLGGGGEAPGAPDGSATTDGARPAPSTDGGAEASFAPPDSGPIDCAAPNTFCDDFDQGALGATWDDIERTHGDVKLSQEALSPPNALAAGVTPGTNTGDAALVKRFSPAPAAIHCELDFNLDSPVPVDIFQIRTVVGGKARYHYVGYRSADWAVGEWIPASAGQPETNRSSSIASLALKRWAKLVVDMNDTSITATLDGQPLGSLTGISAAGGSRRDLAIGLPDVPKSDTASILVDNVRCVVTP
ncbi:MAG: hypothetical protein KC657_00555 [Myxococcales bacterium]|nr:hypothetical protein [Myxococcales bacterium]